MRNLCKLVFDNKYTLSVENPNGKKEYSFGNVVLNNMLNCNFNFTKVRIGSGTGTPANTDTDVFTKLWDIDCTTTVTADTENNTATFTLVGEIPPDASHVATITELGVMVNSTVVTHALIKDAEGNPITIEKDDLTRIIVTARITVGYSVSAPWIVNPIEHSPCYMRKAKIDHGRSASYGWGGFTGSYTKQILELATNSNAAIGAGEGSNAYSYIGTSYGNWGTFGTPYGYGADVKSDDTKVENGKLVRKYNFRLPATMFSAPVYFNTVIFGGLCYAELPNENIVPSYEIQNYTVGTGDGETKDFLCPFSYFVKGSDKVMVDGSALVSGTDYTVINDSNYEMLQELTPFARAVVRGGNYNGCVSGEPGNRMGLFLRPLFEKQPTVSMSYGNTNGYCFIDPNFNYVTRILKDNPAIFDLGQSYDLNKFMLPSNFTAATYTLSVSDDDKEYTQVFSEKKDKNTVLSVDFTARGRYWKLASSEDTTALTAKGTYNNPVPNSDSDPKSWPFLGLVKDGYIHFKNAPKKGAAITMTVMMDRPFKSSETVIDYSAELDITI